MLGYIGLVFVAFKVVKIKINAISIAAAALIGVFLMAAILIAWKMSAPISDQMTFHQKVTQLLANQDSKEFITKIHVKHDQPVKKGDPLYEVDSIPNQIQVDRWTAQVDLSEENLLQAEAGVEVAKAEVEEAEANRAWRKLQLESVLKTREENPGAVAKLNVETAQQTYKVADAKVSSAVAQEQAAEMALTGAKNVLLENKAQLKLAQLNLGQNITRAPSDGYIINWQAVEGTMTTTVISNVQGTFLDTSQPGVVAAIFPQNLVKNIEVGNPVEIAFKSMPGKIVDGKVDAILEWTGEGQIQPGGKLPIAANLKSKGFMPVRITIDDENLADEIPLGAAGSVAIYTNTLKPFHVISRITIRIKMWMNYLPM